MLHMFFERGASVPDLPGLPMPISFSPHLGAMPILFDPNLTK